MVEENFFTKNLKKSKIVDILSFENHLLSLSNI